MLLIYSWIFSLLFIIFNNQMGKNKKQTIIEVYLFLCLGFRQWGELSPGTFQQKSW